MNEKIYIRLDGDKIGDSIELSLMNSNPNEAQNIHNRVQKSINEVVKFINSLQGTSLLLVGSDDILFSILLDYYDKNILKEIAEIFFRNSEFTLSFGVGSNISTALNNLTKAKLSGRNCIID